MVIIDFILIDSNQAFAYFGNKISNMFYILLILFLSFSNVWIWICDHICCCFYQNQLIIELYKFDS